MKARPAAGADDLYIQCILGDPVVHAALAQTVENPIFPTARELMGRCRVLLFDLAQGFVAFEPIKRDLPSKAYEIHICFLPGQDSAVPTAIEAALEYMFLETTAEIVVAKLSFISPRRPRLLMLASRLGFRIRCEDDHFTIISLTIEDWAMRHGDLISGSAPGKFDGNPIKTRLFHSAWRTMKMLDQNGMPEKGVKVFQAISILLGREPNFSVETLQPLTVRLDGVTITVNRGEPCQS